MRYAIWAAVSTESQAAEDKSSLDNQVARCREVGERHGWVEVAAYIVPGESRTRYVNLSDAEREIPPLHEMLEAAKACKFELIVMYDLNRLRDLLPLVQKSLDSYRVQLYSVSQPVEPVDPATYDPYASDTASMMSGMAAILSRAQIADLRRKYTYSMPRRAQRGLPVNVPYGYRRVDNKRPPEILPEQAAHILEMRDMLLGGASLGQICDKLNAEGVKPRRGKMWHRQAVKGILVNPFYTGQVRWGISRQSRDPRTNKLTRDMTPDPDRMIVAQGRHEALWDEGTRQLIIEALKKRGRGYTAKHANQLTGLLYCGVCGGRMWSQYRYENLSRSTEERRWWSCETAFRRTGKGHPRLKHSLAVKLVGEALRQAVLDTALDGNAMAQPDTGRLDDLTAQRQRLLDAYQAGVIPMTDYAGRVAELDEEIERERARQTDGAVAVAEAKQRKDALAMLRKDADYIPGWLVEADALEVNNVLRLLVSKIIWRDGGVELVGR